MTANNISEADRLEQINLEQIVSDLDRRIALAPIEGRAVLSRFLSNARARLDLVEKKIKDAEREQKSAEANSIHSLAEREIGLSGSEKAEFSGFLSKDFFTKQDFKGLEHFYSHAWERLSNTGKEELSHRFWEGIRKGEYEFRDAPQSVREKETKMAYAVLEKQDDRDSSRTIPPVDRADLIRAYESGRFAEAEKVLERPVFKDKLFLTSPSRPIVKAVEDGRESEREGKAQAAVGQTDRPEIPPVKGAGKAATDLTALKLDGLKLTDATSAPLTANLPRTDEILSRRR